MIWVAIICQIIISTMTVCVYGLIVHWNGMLTRSQSLALIAICWWGWFLLAVSNLIEVMA